MGGVFILSSHPRKEEQAWTCDRTLLDASSGAGFVSLDYGLSHQKSHEARERCLSGYPQTLLSGL